MSLDERARPWRDLLWQARVIPTVHCLSTHRESPYSKKVWKIQYDRFLDLTTRERRGHSQVTIEGFHSVWHEDVAWMALEFVAWEISLIESEGVARFLQGYTGLPDEETTRRHVNYYMRMAEGLHALFGDHLYQEMLVLASGGDDALSRTG